MKEDAVFVDVARRITPDPPDWLPLVLERFAPTEEDDNLNWLIKKTVDAIDHLLRFLPAFEDLRPGLAGKNQNIRMVLALLPGIRKDFERGVRKGTGRRVDIRKIICAGVMLEAWALCRLVEPHSLEFREACAAYWAACGGKALGDPTHWRHPIEKALGMDWGWIRSIMVAVKNSP